MLRLGFEVCTSVLRNLESIEINSQCKEKSLRRKVTAKNSQSKEDSMQRTFTAKNIHCKEKSLQRTVTTDCQDYIQGSRVPRFQVFNGSKIPRLPPDTTPRPRDRNPNGIAVGNFLRLHGVLRLQYPGVQTLWTTNMQSKCSINLAYCLNFDVRKRSKDV